MSNLLGRSPPHLPICCADDSQENDVQSRKKNQVHWLNTAVHTFGGEMAPTRSILEEKGFLKERIPLSLASHFHSPLVIHGINISSSPAALLPHLHSFPSRQLCSSTSPLLQRILHLLQKRLSGLSTSSSSAGPKGDSSSSTPDDDDEDRRFLEETLLRSGGGDTRLPPRNYQPTSSHPPQDSRVSGFSSYFPGIFRSFDPYDNLPLLPTDLRYTHPLSTVSTMADDEELTQEAPMAEQVKEELEKARESTERIGNHFEFCKKIYPREYHTFLLRGCKKDCRSWLWKTSKGQHMRRIMNKRRIPVPNY